ncbi:hypothetical protein [Methanosarcina sp. Kolksee]|uniref:Pepco domain-containing protein n=1 Tax=Methanosarcina sp. Kolksee TaxID=1434099 RepID=UPI00064F19D1|nr:hypothetical protein [Methanosarcina sp. Kolksee]
MNGDQVNSISITTVEYTDIKPSMMPSQPKLMTKITQVNAKLLQENLFKFLDEILPIVSSLPNTNCGYDIDGITFNLSIGANGNISLLGVGEVGSALQSGISITLKKG